MRLHTASPAKGATPPTHSTHVRPLPNATFARTSHSANTHNSPAAPAALATRDATFDAILFSEGRPAWLDVGEARTAALALLRDTVAVDSSIVSSLSARLLANDAEDTRGHHVSLVAALAESGAVDAALAFAQNAPASRRTEELALVFSLTAAQDPAAARELATLLQAPGPTPVLTAVLKNWAELDPSQVATYALSLPAGPTRSLAISSALEPWLHRDPLAALAWIDTLSNSTERDPALCAWIVATDSTHRPPEAALHRAAGIVDRELRLRATTAALREWSAQDPAGARQFIHANVSDLPAPPATLLAAISRGVPPVEAE